MWHWGFVAGKELAVGTRLQIQYSPSLQLQAIRPIPRRRFLHIISQFQHKVGRLLQQNRQSIAYIHSSYPYLCPANQNGESARYESS